MVGRICAALLTLVAAVAAQTPNCTQFKNCQSCIAFTNATCYFCNQDNTCNLFVANTIFNFNTQSCSKLQYFVSQCVVPAYGFAIIIAGGGLLILLCCVCICCAVCCCLQKRRKKYSAISQVRYYEEKAEIEQRNAKKKSDNKEKYDEMRRKYGTGPYAEYSPSSPYTKI